MDKTPEPKIRVGFATILILPFLTGVCDLLQWLLSVFVVTSFLASVAGFMGWLIAWTWFTLIGVKLFDFEKPGWSIATILLELIPFVDLLPALTFRTVQVIVNTRSADKASHQAWAKKQGKAGQSSKPTRPPQPRYV